MVYDDFFEFLQLGERGSSSRPNQPVQDFVQLRDKCLQEGVLFEDPSFPADESSIYFSRKSGRHFEWLRPTVSHLIDSIR